MSNLEKMCSSGIGGGRPKYTGPVDPKLEKMVNSGLKRPVYVETVNPEVGIAFDGSEIEVEAVDFGTEEAVQSDQFVSSSATEEECEIPLFGV